MAELVYQRPYSSRSYPSLMVLRVINVVLSIIEFLLALRIVLELLGASASSQFVAWVYAVTDALIGPFASAFPNWSVGGFVIDVSAIFAMIGYAIIAWLVSWLLSMLVTNPLREGVDIYR